jgi:hypothetical protein
MYYATRWITLEEAKLLYPDYPIIKTVKVTPPPIKLPTELTHGPKFNRGKRKVKKW